MAQVSLSHLTEVVAKHEFNTFTVKVESPLLSVITLLLVLNRATVSDRTGEDSDTRRRQEEVR